MLGTSSLPARVTLNRVSIEAPRKIPSARELHGAAWASRLQALSSSAWFAYGTILLLQLHRIWWVWSRRDLSGGDTAQYFADAWRFYSTGRTGIAWSPLYTMLYGSLLHTHLGEAGVTVLHRVLIVLGAAVLVLAVLRRLLPPLGAWVLAAWWAVLPVNCDPMYEVHLFALLPILASWWLILAVTNPWGCGMAIAMLALEAALVRNEMFILAAGTAAVCLAWEWRRVSGPAASRVRSLARVATAYAIPCLLAFVAVAWVYRRSRITWPELSEILHTKHTMNMAQTYAFGYGQRHPEWAGDPWRQYQGLARRDFRTEQPSLVQMLRVNPRALLTHVGWNLRLLPAGLQVMLFNATSDRFDPDYRGVPLRSRNATAASIILAGVAIAGGFIMWRNRRFWWRAWLRRRSLGWAAMLCGLPVALLIVATQRPRPEYLYNLTVLLLASIGTCWMPLALRFRKNRPLSAALPLLMLLAMMAAPSVYRQRRPRPIAGEYRRLMPSQTVITRPGAVVLSPHSIESSMYVGHGEAQHVPYTELSRLAPNESLAAFLDARGVTVFILNDACRGMMDSLHPGAADAFLGSAPQHGWTIAPQQSEGRSGGVLLIRQPPNGQRRDVPSAVQQPRREIPSPEAQPPRG